MIDRGSRSEFITIRGLRYHIRRWGDPKAPALFLGHGWLDVSATFHYVAQALMPQFQILAPDWRGFGHSQWPQDGYWFHDYVADLEGILAHYSPTEPVLLAGHSMGAQITSLFAGLRPERVKKLIAIDGLFMPDMEVSSAPRRFRRWLDQINAPARQKSYSSYEELALRVGKQHPQLSAERALFVARCWGNEDGHGRITLCADPKHRLDMPSLYRADQSMEIWKQVTAPVLLLDAGKSSFINIITPELMQQRRDCFAKHERVVVPKAGHMMHFDAPEETAQHMAQFLSQ